MILQRQLGDIFQDHCIMAEQQAGGGHTLDNALRNMDDKDMDPEPQHKDEVDLDKLSEDQLQELANGHNVQMDYHGIRKELSRFRKTRRTISVRDKLEKLNSKINGIRAQMKLMQRKDSGSWFRQVSNKSPQKQQAAQQAAASSTQSAPQAQQQRQQASHLQSSLSKRPHSLASAPSRPQAGQPANMFMQFGSRSQRFAAGIQQQRQQQGRPTPIVAYATQAGGTLDTVMSLAGPKAKQQQQQRAGSVDGIPGPAPFHHAVLQQQEWSGQPQYGWQGQPGQQALQQHGQLQLTPGNASTGGLSHGRQASQARPSAALLRCQGCDYVIGNTDLDTQEGQPQLCSQCKRNQHAELARASAQKRNSSIDPQLPPAAPAAGRARDNCKATKPAGNKDAPITIDSGDDDDGAVVAQDGLSEGQQQRRRSERIVNLTPSEQGAAIKFAGLQAVYPPEGGVGAVHIVADDLARLDPDEFLNDTIIDYYIKCLELELAANNPSVRDRFHFFNSFFFKKLTEKSEGKASSKEEEARRNHERVKNWTKGVDIFEKDFLFVPIHDALHWSLIIICHPGLLPIAANSIQSAATKAGAAAVARATAASAAGQGGTSGSPGGGGGGGCVAMAAGGGQAIIEPKPCIVHLDSMTGGHSTPQVAAPLRQYLEQEWARKQTERRQQARQQQQHDVALSSRLQSDAAAGSQEEQDLLKVAAKNLPAQKVIALPRQDNHCDCGLFVLTYMDYFTHAAPSAINPKVILAINSKKTAATAAPLLSAEHPHLLRQTWFDPAIASCLRTHLRQQLLQLMVQQAPDKDAPAVVAATADMGAYNEQLKLSHQWLQGPQPVEIHPVFAYMRPAEYHPGVQEQLQAYEERQQQRNKQLKAQRHAAAAAKRNAGGSNAGRSDAGKSNAERQRDEYNRQQAVAAEAAWQREDRDASADAYMFPGGDDMDCGDEQVLDLVNPPDSAAVAEKRQKRLTANANGTTSEWDHTIRSTLPEQQQQQPPSHKDWSPVNASNEDFQPSKKRPASGQQQEKEHRNSRKKYLKELDTPQLKQQQLHSEEIEDLIVPNPYVQQREHQLLHIQGGRKRAQDSSHQQGKRRRSHIPDDAGASASESSSISDGAGNTGDRPDSAGADGCTEGDSIGYNSTESSSDASHGQQGQRGQQQQRRRRRQPQQRHKDQQQQEQQWQQQLSSGVVAAAEQEDMSVSPKQQAAAAVADGVEQQQLSPEHPSRCKHALPAAADDDDDTVDLCNEDDEPAQQQPSPNKARTKQQQQHGGMPEDYDEQWMSWKLHKQQQSGAIGTIRQQQTTAAAVGGGVIANVTAADLASAKPEIRELDAAVARSMVGQLYEDQVLQPFAEALARDLSCRYGSDLGAALRSNQVYQEDVNVILARIKGATGILLPTHLLPCFLEELNTWAANMRQQDCARLEKVKRTWSEKLNGNQQQQQQGPTPPRRKKKPQNLSVAAAVADSLQRRLTDVMQPDITYSRPVDALQMKADAAKLRQRQLEEQQKTQDSMQNELDFMQQHNSENDSEQREAQLQLQMSPSHEGPSGRQVNDQRRQQQRRWRRQGKQQEEYIVLDSSDDQVQDAAVQSAAATIVNGAAQRCRQQHQPVAPAPWGDQGVPAAATNGHCSLQLQQKQKAQQMHASIQAKAAGMVHGGDNGCYEGFQSSSSSGDELPNKGLVGWCVRVEHLPRRQQQEPHQQQQQREQEAPVKYSPMGVGSFVEQLRKEQQEVIAPSNIVAGFVEGASHVLNSACNALLSPAKKAMQRLCVGSGDGNSQQPQQLQQTAQPLHGSPPLPHEMMPYNGDDSDCVMTDNEGQSSGDVGNVAAGTMTPGRGQAAAAAMLQQRVNGGNKQRRRRRQQQQQQLHIAARQASVSVAGAAAVQQQAVQHQQRMGLRPRQAASTRAVAGSGAGLPHQARHGGFSLRAVDVETISLHQQLSAQYIG